MDVTSINNGLLNSLKDLTLEELLRGKNDKDLLADAAAQNLTPEAALAAQRSPEPEATRPAAKASRGQENPLARNFVSTEAKESKYLAATMAAFSAARMLEQSEKHSVTSMIEEYAPLVGRTEAYTQMRMRRKAGQKVMEEAQEELKRERKRIEEKAEEAMAPKDTNGNPIPGLTADPLPGEAAPAAPASAPAPLPAYSPAPTPGPGGADVAATVAADLAAAGLAPGPAPAQATINIIV